jgi:ABC-2 type transport system permease protein
MMLVWFILGFALYATAFAVLGALASRMEEASNVTTPVTMVAVLTYLVSLTVVTQQPDALLARVMTFLPPAAPIVVPLRAALNAIEPWEIVVAAILTVATIYALFAVGGRVYSGAALASGGRAKLRDAWRSGAR